MLSWASYHAVCNLNPRFFASQDKHLAFFLLLAKLLIGKYLCEWLPCPYLHAAKGVPRLLD